MVTIKHNDLNGLSRRNPVMGVLKIEHIPTGKFYIDISRNVVYKAHTCFNQLNKNKHSNSGLQEVFNTDPVFNVYISPTATVEEAIFIQSGYYDKYENDNIFLNNYNDISRNAGAYLLVHDKTGRMYVGSTNDMDRRITEHLSLMKTGRHCNVALIEAYKDNPQFTIKKMPTESKEDALNIEQAVLNDHVGTDKLFNIATDARRSALGRIGGEHQKEVVRRIHTGKTVSEYTRRLLSRLNVGKKRSAETVEKIREANRGRTLSEVSRNKVRQSKLGVPRSEETKAKLRAANLGRKMSEETKAKIAIRNKGKVVSEHTRALLSSRSKGRVYSEEIKKKMADAYLNSETYSKRQERLAELGRSNGKAVKVGDQTFYSVKEASRHYGISDTAVNQRIKSTTDKFKDWSYA